MASMYPVNETLELFGETVSWPGVDENGKFTNGDLSDPAVRPSFIPAETINLILDNISELLVALGKTPDNQSTNQLAIAIKAALQAEEQARASADQNLYTAILAISPEFETNVQSVLDLMEEIKTIINTHKTTATLDHPNGSVTAVKLASNAVTTVKVTDKNITYAKVQDVTADTTSTKPTFSATAVTFSAFLQAVWRGITWLTAKLNASSGHKHTGGTDDAPRVSVAALDYPVGWKYIQLPNDEDPAGLGFVGNWEKWNTRVEIYGLSTSLPSYATYAAGANYAANAYVLYTYPDGDQEILQAIAAVTQAPAILDPIKWRTLDVVSTSSYRPLFVERVVVQSSWTAADLAIGATVSNAPVSGNNSKRVACKYVLGGKFPSFAGGNRPPFVSGGIGRDAIRNFTGRYMQNYSETPSTNMGTSGYNGPFYLETNAHAALNERGISTEESSTNKNGYGFDPSRVVPAGPENSPRTLSVQYWRRVS